MVAVELPIELRHEIYILAASTPRVVEVRGYRSDVKNKESEFFMKSNALVPAIMHACVDSRAAGLKIYSALIFNAFTGTYINWDVDWIMFKGNTERLYMAYENSLEPSQPHFDIRQKVQRLAIRRRKLRYYPLRYEDLPIIRRMTSERSLLYPSLRSVAAYSFYEVVTGRTQNLTIMSSEKMTIKGKVDDPIKQDVLWMCLTPGGNKPVVNKPKHPKLPPPIMAKTPTEATLARLHISHLRSIARDRGLSELGYKRDLVAVIKMDMDASYPETLEAYKNQLKGCAAKMLGFADAPEGVVYGEDVISARAKEVSRFLKERGLI